MPKALYFLLTEQTFLYLQLAIVSCYALEYFPEVILVLVHITRGYYDVIQIGSNKGEVLEEPIHHPLKGGRGIHNPERHNLELKRSEAGD